jgi:apoptosis-inducing factor 3
MLSNKIFKSVRRIIPVTQRSFMVSSFNA